MIKINKIYNQDCAEILKQLPDKSINLFLEDMPYNMLDCNWEYKMDLKEYWELRLSKLADGGVFALTGSQPFTTDLINSNRKMFKYEWIWQKNMASNFLNAKIMPLKIHENILIFYKKQPIYNPQKIKIKPYNRKNCNAEKTKAFKIRDKKKDNYREDNKKGLGFPYSILKFTHEKDRNNSFVSGKRHPSKKPVNLFRYLIKTYTNEGDTVFDGYLGSGTTAIACLEEKRNFICCELDKEYFEMAQKRIENFKNQTKLF